MQLVKMMTSALMIATLAACGGVGGPSGPVEVDASGASSLALGSGGALQDTDVRLVGTDGDVVVITTEGGSVEAGVSGSGVVEIDSSGAAVVEIQAPNTLGYAIFLSDHNAEVIDVEAPGAIQVNNGDVTVDGATEELAIQVNNGDADVRYTDADLPEIGIQVNDGDVVLTLPSDANAELAVTAESIDISGLDDDDVLNFGGTAAGTLGAGGGSIAIQAGGTVTIVGE
jgi:hypothetical protein